MTELVQTDCLFSYLEATNGRVIGIVTLNRAKALNSLNHNMVLALWRQLKAWESDSSVALVVVQGAGEKAFCAGGDVRDIYALVAPDKPFPDPVVTDYFCHEYRVDYLIHRYKKPVLVWGEGVVMGGGMGLMQGASHRVVCENSLLAMPENTIGIFPDVGASWFLQRMPGRTGLFAGVTGFRFSAADALYAGLADVCVSAQVKADLITTMQRHQWTGDQQQDEEALTEILGHHGCDEVSIEQSQLRHHAQWVAEITELASAELFVEALIESRNESTWHEALVARVEAASPVALKVIWAQLQRSRTWGLEQVFLSEMDLIMRTTHYPDFSEGVRALLVDKDNQPKWQHASVGEVDDHVVDELLSPVWSEQENPLRPYLNRG